MTLAISPYSNFYSHSFGSPMPDRTFVPQACSTQTVVLNNYTYQDNFPNPVPLWNPVGGAAIGWAGPGAMTVNCNIPNEGAQQVLPCVPGVTNVLDLTLTFGNNMIQVTLLDPLTLLPLPGYPVVYPAVLFGTIQNIQLFFIGPPSGNVIVQITSPGGPMPYPDMFMVNYAAISTQSTIQSQVCWDEDYRFGFNGKEKDNEASGQGNQYDYGFRIYNPRLGKFLSIDPLSQDFPHFTPYQYASNSPILNIDLDGLEGTPGTIDRRRNLANAPPSPGGQPYIVYEYQRVGGQLQRRKHYMNIDPNSPMNTNLQNRALPNNGWSNAVPHPSGNILWESLGDAWAPKPRIAVVNVQVINNLTQPGLTAFNPAGNAAAGAAVSVVALNAQIATANAATAALNTPPVINPPVALPPAIGTNPNVAPNGGGSLTNGISQLTTQQTAVNTNFSVTMTVQNNSPYFNSVAANMSAGLGGIPVTIVVNPALALANNPTTGAPANLATDFNLQLNYNQTVTNTNTTTSTQTTSSNYVSPIAVSAPGTP